jgi:hypothetical protein
MKLKWPVNEVQTKQRSKSLKQIRSRSRNISSVPIRNQATRAHTELGTDKHDFNKENMKNIKALKEAISYRTVKEIGLPEVSS